MVDFSKFRVRTAEEMRAEDEKRHARAVDEDLARRRERSRRSVSITLEDDAESRVTLSGPPLIHLRGSQADRKPVRTTWFAPDHMSRDEFDNFLRPLVHGSCLKLDGYWKPFTNHSGKTNFTFIAQFIELG